MSIQIDLSPFTCLLDTLRKIYQHPDLPPPLRSYVLMELKRANNTLDWHTFLTSTGQFEYLD